MRNKKKNILMNLLKRTKPLTKVIVIKSIANRIEIYKDMLWVN